MKIVALLLAALFVASAAAHQEPAAVRRAIDDYLRIQTQGLPGQVSYTFGALDPHNNLTPCAAFEVSHAPGARSWGRTTLKVSCVQENGWSIFVSAHIKVVANYLITQRPLTQGQVVTPADIGVQSGDLSDLPSGTLSDASQAVGRTLSMSIPAGRPLRGDMLRLAPVVQQGQSVKVVSKGPGFSVANEGRALNSAGDGQVAQVRLANGQVVSGIARPGGQVEVGY